MAGQESIVKEIKIKNHAVSINVEFLGFPFASHSISCTLSVVTLMLLIILSFHVIFSINCAYCMPTGIELLWEFHYLLLMT